MKKFYIVVSLLVFTFFIGISNISAKVFSYEDIKTFSEFTIEIEDGDDITTQSNVFILGKHVYFNFITAFDVFEAMKTVGDVENAVLYFKDGNGDLFNALTGDEIENADELLFDITKIVKEKQSNETEITGDDDAEVNVNDDTITEEFDPEIVIEEMTVVAGNPIEMDELGENKLKHVWNQNHLYAYSYESSPEWFDDPRYNLFNDEDYYVISLDNNDILKSYTNGAGLGKWVSIIVDLGVNPDDLTVTGYSIEEIDKNPVQVKRHGGDEVTETAFIMWLNAEVDTRKIVFTYKSGQKINVVVKGSPDLDIVTYESMGNITGGCINCYEPRQNTFLDFNETGKYFVVGNGVTSFDFYEDDVHKICTVNEENECDITIPFEIKDIRHATLEELGLDIKPELMTEAEYNYLIENYGKVEVTYNEFNGLVINELEPLLDGNISIPLVVDVNAPIYELENRETNIEYEFGVRGSRVLAIENVESENDNMFLIHYYAFDKDVRDSVFMVTDRETEKILTVPFTFIGKTQLILGLYNDEVFEANVEGVDFISYDFTEEDEAKHVGIFSISDGIEEFIFTVKENAEATTEHIYYAKRSLSPSFIDCYDWDFQLYNDITVKKATVLEPNEEEIEQGWVDEHEYNQDSYEVAGIKDLTTEDGLKYREVTINANRELKPYSNGNPSHPVRPWYALVVDLGMDLDHLVSIGGESLINGESLNYTIEPSDIESTSKARHGATGKTDFVLWLNAYAFERPIAFCYESGESTFRNESCMNVVFIFNSVEEIEYEAIGDVVINEDLADDVKYIDTEDFKGFTVRLYPQQEDEIVEFDFTDDNVSLLASYDGEWHIGRELVLENVKAGTTTNLNENELKKESMIYNQASIESVEKVITEDANTINVSLNRTLETFENGAGTDGKWYALLLDFEGMQVDKIGSVTEGENRYGIEPADIVAENVAKFGGVTANGEFIIWVSEEATAGNGKIITFVNKDNENITYEVVIKSTHVEVEGIEYLKVANVKKASFTDIPETDPYYDEMNYNNTSIESVTIDEENANIVNIVMNRALDKYDNGYLEKEWYPIIIDMNVAHDNLGTIVGGYNIAADDKLTVARFGGSLENGEIILWLRADEEQAITFKNLSTDNKYDEYTVTFNVTENFKNFVGITQTKTENLFSRYYNQYSIKKYINAPEDYDLTGGYTLASLPETFEEDVWLEIGEYTGEEIPNEITINGITFDDELKKISIGNSSYIFMPVFKVKEEKLYVGLTWLVASATPDTVFEIVFGDKTYRVQAYNNHYDNDLLTYTVSAIADYMPETRVAQAVRVEGTDTVDLTYSHLGFIAGVYFSVNGEELPEDTLTFRLDTSGNMGITSADWMGTYSMYARYGTTAVETYRRSVSERTIVIPGYGSKTITFNLTEVPLDELD